MRTIHVVLTQTVLTSLAPWQEAIDDAGWPLRLTGYEGSLLGTASIRAKLKDVATEFSLEHHTRQSFVERWPRAEIPDRWRYYVSIAERLPKTLSMRSAAASVPAFCAYGIASGGMGYSPGSDYRGERDMTRTRDNLRTTLPIWIETFIDGAPWREDR